MGTAAGSARTPVTDKPLMHYGPRELRRTAEGEPETTYAQLKITPMTPHLGAQVDGVDLAGPIDAELAAELRAALLEWKVLFFRGQDRLDEPAHLAVARLWGEPEPNPFFPTTGQVGVSRLAKDATKSGTENIWHSDHSFMAAPALGSVLRAIEVPPAGGDTMWADMAVAYENLPQATKDRIADLRAVHDWVPSWGSVMSPEQIAALRPALPPVVHPVVVRHPRSGRQVLYVNEPFTTLILGLSDKESRALLAELVLQARVPEYQVRFRWEPGSVAIWDNIAVQHYAINDYYPMRRVMERVAIAGVPLS